MENTDVIEVAIQLRKAVPEDLKTDSKNLKVGQAFWLKSAITGEFMKGPINLNWDIDVDDLADWLRNGMIYVPVRWQDSLTK